MEGDGDGKGCVCHATVCCVCGVFSLLRFSSVYPFLTPTFFFLILWFFSVPCRLLRLITWLLFLFNECYANRLIPRASASFPWKPTHTPHAQPPPSPTIRHPRSLSLSTHLEIGCRTVNYSQLLPHTTATALPLCHTVTTGCTVLSTEYSPTVLCIYRTQYIPHSVPSQYSVLSTR